MIELLLASAGGPALPDISLAFATTILVGF